MPPSASLPIVLAFYGLFYLVLPASGLQSFFAGFLAGYVVYDLIHYSLHHAGWRAPWFVWLKRNHLQHHFVEPDRRYGVSYPLWDILLRSGGDWHSVALGKSTAERVHSGGARIIN